MRGLCGVRPGALATGHRHRKNPAGRGFGAAFPVLAHGMEQGSGPQRQNVLSSTTPKGGTNADAAAGMALSVLGRTSLGNRPGGKPEKARRRITGLNRILSAHRKAI